MRSRSTSSASAAAAGGDLLLLDEGQDVALVHGVAGLDRHLGKAAAGGRRDLVLHLHRFDDQDRAAGHDLIARPRR